MAVLDHVVASPHQGLEAEEKNYAGMMSAEVRRLGLLTALAITAHNFPEGLATFFATLDNPHVGMALAIAIAVHNIPEGITVSVPIYFATGSRRKAFYWSMLSGLAEPVLSR